MKTISVVLVTLALTVSAHGGIVGWFTGKNGVNVKISIFDFVTPWGVFLKKWRLRLLSF
jgi:hypothetical protein